MPFNLVKNTVFSGDSLIITATFSGVQIYNRSTAKWRNIGLHNVQAVVITPSNFLYAGTNEGIYKCLLNDENWELLKIANDTTLIVYNVLAINDDTIFAATSNNLRRTTNGGKSWQKLEIGTGFLAQGMFYNNSLYVTGYLSGTSNLFKTSDLGESFQILISSIDTYNITNPISVLNNKYIYISSRSSAFNGVIKSSDSGNNWQIVYPSEALTCAIYSNNEGLVISATSAFSINDTDKIVISTDFGSSWKTILQPIRRGTSIIDIKKDQDNKFYFGTGGEGLYEIDIITSVKQEETIPQNFSILQNYPNPFNPVTTIEFSLPSPLKGEGSGVRFVSLKVYDVLGNEVATLVNEFKSAGSYNINFDASKLSSGVYYYTLRAGEFVSVKKMMLLK